MIRSDFCPGQDVEALYVWCWIKKEKRKAKEKVFNSFCLKADKGKTPEKDDEVESKKRNQ